jgi:hypothetical protein
MNDIQFHKHITANRTRGSYSGGYEEFYLLGYNAV